MIAALHRAVPRMEELRFREPVNWCIGSEEHWAVIGPNGAGKSLLADLLLGRCLLLEGSREYRYGNRISEWARMISFNDLYSLPNTGESYYQQRWNSSDIASVPPVRALLGQPAGQKDLFRESSRFYLGPMLDKPVLALSCGEMRKFLIVKAMLASPKLLILDNPYVGLDMASREELSAIFTAIAAHGGMQLVLLVSDPADIPEVITHVLPVKDLRLLQPRTKAAFLGDTALIRHLFETDIAGDAEFPARQPLHLDSPEVFRLEQTSIRYGENILLDRISWQVNRGEQWNLYGPNGSGKSTLISLLYGDNPQAYAQKVYLFGRRRGTGESIWDIKRPIGYLSPEMQLHFNTPMPAVDIVASGFFDTIGLFRKPTPEQRLFASGLMVYFGIGLLAERIFTRLSSGEQRLVLLCRALVKEPAFLILDEPMQGLDAGRKSAVKSALTHFINKEERTLLYVSHNTAEIPDSVTGKFILPEGKAE